jgi:D-cysteine desulfhydrase
VSALPRRLRFCHLPTPLVQDEKLSSLLGVELWIKRDDCTGGAEAGNKVRKLEFLLAEAVATGASDVVTCGGLQSNHARATAILAARLGLGCTLLLRTDGATSGPERDAEPGALPAGGNVLLDRLVGAHIRTITPAQYARRSACMLQVSREIAAAGAGRRAYVIPEGGSNGLGAFGYIEAMREVREQMDLGLGPAAPFDAVVHACGSGGTAAGVAIGCAAHHVAARVHAVAVCDDAAYFERAVRAVVDEASGIAATGARAPVPLTIDDRSKGPRYGVMDDAQRAFLVRVARTAGVLLDPVYTGKAMFGLQAAIGRGDIARGTRILFLHTGGLPGLLAEGDALAPSLAGGAS